MNKEKIKQISNFSAIFDDMPDGAFFALAEEQGIDEDDWFEYNNLSAIDIFKAEFEVGGEVLEKKGNVITKFNLTEISLINKK